MTVRSYPPILTIDSRNGCGFVKTRMCLMVFLFVMVVIVLPLHVSAASIVNPKQVYTYEQMEQDIKKLAERYPELIAYEVIGKSEYGRNIYAVSLGKGLSTSYINGSNHAREWISTNLVMNMIEQYAKAYQENRKLDSYDVKALLDQHTIWFVPMMNPDGVTLQQKGLDAFPKELHASLIAMNNGSRDFKRWKANGKGVDLNRQFDANWANIKNSPGKPWFANYKGPAPHHAAEVKAVIDFTYQIKPEMAVSYHSSGSILFWQFRQQGAQYQRDLAHAMKISRMTSYPLVHTNNNTGGGGYTDWFIQTFKKPAFTPELGTYVGNTHVPLAQFDRIWRENRLVGLYIAAESHKMYMNRKLAQLVKANLVINGVTYKGDVGAVISEGRTLVPVRGIFEEIGATVHYEARDRSITIRKGGNTVVLTVNKRQAYVNGELVELDVPAQLIHSRTLVPVRFISEAIGATVHWEQATKTVGIVYQDPTVMEPEVVEKEEELPEPEKDLVPVTNEIVQLNSIVEELIEETAE